MSSPKDVYVAVKGGRGKKNQLEIKVKYIFETHA